MRRWVILVLGIPVYTFLLMVLATGIMGALAVQDWASEDWSEILRELFDLLRDGEWWAYVGGLTIVGVGVQALFVIPVIGKRPPKAPRSRSLKISLIIAAAVASGLTFGLIFAFATFAEVVLEMNLDFDGSTAEMLVTAIFVGSWAFWSAVLLFYCRGIWADRTLGRVVGLLIGGTVLEALVVLPLDIMVRRRTDCYCFAGTLFALCIATVATLWLAGPGIVIALTSKKHRRWREFHCFRCGYAKGPSPGAVCPECGYAWLDAPPTAK